MTNSFGANLSLLDSRVRLPTALAVGATMAVSLWALSTFVAKSGRAELAGLLYWQDAWLQGIALSRQGSPDDPTPSLYRLLNLPVGALVYGGAIYALLYTFARLRRG